MSTDSTIAKLQEDLNKSGEHTLHEFTTLHTGKANTSMAENVTVDVYGSSMKLRDIAAITTPDARTIQIQPWDKSNVAPIEKALIEANLGISPVVTGELIRLPIPELSGERREELCKMAQGMAEQGRIGARAARREALDALKAAQKEGQSEDEVKRLEKEVQKEVDNAIARINTSLSAKEAELRQP